MSLLNIAMLKHYAQSGRNVLFEGHRGVGKTATIKSVFDEVHPKWKYFSTSTMDPWVDLVGMPKVKEREGLRPVADLIRPWYIEDDFYEAIFLDELNRASTKTLDAVLELIQFRSINGHKLNNLKCVWAAINPYDENGTYLVEELDPALIDRFHCRIIVPYKLDEQYLMSKYSAVAIHFIEWWNSLPDDIKEQISPRRLEYMIEGHLDGSRLEDFVGSNPKINLKDLRSRFKSLPFRELLANTQDATGAKEILQDPNNMLQLLEMVKKKDKAATEFFTKFQDQLPQEAVAPFVEAVAASVRKNAKTVTLKSFEQFVDLLPGNDQKADAGTGTMINDLDFSVMFAAQGYFSVKEGFEQSIKQLVMQKPNLVRKLANRLADIIFSCRENTIERLLWGLTGEIGNRPTNFNQLVSYFIGARIWSEKQLSVIINKTHLKVQPISQGSAPQLMTAGDWA